MRATRQRAVSQQFVFHAAVASPSGGCGACRGTRARPNVSHHRSHRRVPVASAVPSLPPTPLSLAPHRYLREDLDVEQLNVQLRAGKLTLTDLTVDIDAVNEHLTGLPLRLTAGTIGCINATLSYGSLLAEGCTVELDSLHLTFAPVPPSASGAGAAGGAGDDPGGGGGDDGDVLREAAFGRDHATREGLRTLAAWIEEVTSRIHVTVRDLQLSVTPSPRSRDRLTLHCPLAEFFDETPHLGAASMTASAAAGMRGSVGAGGMQSSFTPNTMHKVLELHGFCVAMHRDGRAAPDSPASSASRSSFGSRASSPASVPRSEPRTPVRSRSRSRSRSPPPPLASSRGGTDAGGAATAGPSTTVLVDSTYRATPSRVKIVIGTQASSTNTVDIDCFVKVCSVHVLGCVSVTSLVP